MKKLLFLSLALACSAGLFSLHAAEPLRLSQVMAAHRNYDAKQKVIACAAGGPEVAMKEPAWPITIYFYPPPGANHFRFFQTDSAAVKPGDFEKYHERAVDGKSLALEPLFNGYLRRFRLGALPGEIWGVVTYELNGAFVLSNPIRFKQDTKPTQMGNDLVSVTARGTTPKFQWDDGRVKENAIYFQVVSNAKGDLVSGTYTEQRQFQFYDLGNVVMNIHDVTPHPKLEPRTDYTFTLMAVSQDNWVNFVAMKPFTTGQ